ncbi:unnamed protein product, partial [Staurois parvus]
MALGRKRLTCGAIKGLTVCCFTYGAMFVFHCKHTALYGCAMHSHAKQSHSNDWAAVPKKTWLQGNC